MSTGDHLLAIDSGTQSVRALLFNLRGDLVASSRVGLEPYYSLHPGWAEQDPAYFWRSLCEACQALWAKAPFLREAVAGVALTSQRATLVNVDVRGEPLRPAIVWLDQRRTEGLPGVGGAWGMLFRLTGVQSTVAHFRAEAEVNWIHRNEPQLWRRTHRFLYLSGYLTYRLVGRYVDSVACQVGYLPLDFRRLR